MKIFSRIGWYDMAAFAGRSRRLLSGRQATRAACSLQQPAATWRKRCAPSGQEVVANHAAEEPLKKFLTAAIHCEVNAGHAQAYRKR